MKQWGDGFIRGFGTDRPWQLSDTNAFEAARHPSTQFAMWISSPPTSLAPRLIDAGGG